MVRPDGSAVDHLFVAVMRGGDGGHNPTPNARLPPPHTVIVASGGAGLSAKTSRATAHPTVASTSCRSARTGHRRAAHLGYVE